MKKKIIILLLGQLLCISTFAGNLAKKYKSHLTEKGIVYFIMPQKMPKAKNCPAYKDLLFDITCLNTSDSISITATIYTISPITDSIAVIKTSQGKTYSFLTKIIYRDLDKKGYINRLKFDLSKRDFREIFNISQPFLLDYGNNYAFAFKNKKWTEERLLINNILNLMELNK